MNVVIIIIIPILQMSKLRLNEFKKLVTKLVKCQSQDLNLEKLTQKSISSLVLQLAYSKRSKMSSIIKI